MLSMQKPNPESSAIAVGPFSPFRHSVEDIGWSSSVLGHSFESEKRSTTGEVCDEDSVRFRENG